MSNADITRDSFRPERHVSGLVMQQARLSLDADWNEQAAVQRLRDAQLGRATVGLVGAARNATGGFDLAVAPTGDDLLLGAGQLWLDGLVVENTPEVVGATVLTASSLRVDHAVLDGQPLAAGHWLVLETGAGAGVTARVATFTAATRTVALAAPTTGVTAGARVRVRRRPSLAAQPHSRDSLGGGVPAPASGQHAVVLDVWQRELTAFDDPSLQETALNGLDTVSRLQVAWRVDLRHVGAAGAHDCGSVPASALPAASTAMLTASVAAPGASANPCILPEAGGYRGLEHQLYRVEVHRVVGGDVVLKWQRDNAHLVTGVTSLGTTLDVEDLGPDPVAGFQADGFVEVVDDRLALAQRSGDLLRIGSIDRALRRIEVDTAFAEPHAETSVTRAAADQRPRARRWDGRVVLARTSSTPVELERGLFVRFHDGTVREGDHWLVPARTASEVDPGTIEWPAADDGTWLPVPPHGVTHHRTVLGLVDVMTTAGAVAFDAGSLVDCRPRFPSLTTLTASDVAVDPTACGFAAAATVQEAIDELCGRTTGTCTRTALPGPGWASVVQGLPTDAEVCFPVGDFPLTERVQVAGSGHLLVHGAGWGSRISVARGGVALEFVGWASVTVRDLSVSAQLGATPPDGLVGALTFRDCGRVLVEHVRAASAGASTPESTCVTIDGTAGAREHEGRVAHCRFDVGERQVGVLGVDLDRFDADDNLVRVTPSNRTITDIMELSAPERTAMAALLIRDLRPGTATGSRVGATIGDRAYSFDAIGAAQAFWRLTVPTLDASSALRFARDADRAVRALFRGDDARTVALPLRAFLRDQVARRRVPTMAQGIVAAGRSLGGVSITGNVVEGAIQGIHVGASHRAPRAGSIDAAERVTVNGNRVAVVIPSEGAAGRHGVFVGNARSAAIRDNEVTFETSSPEVAPPSTAIRVIGFVDRMLQVHENLVLDFPVGVQVRPLLPRGTTQINRPRLYSVRHNMLAVSATAVAVDGPLASRVVVADNV